MTENETELAELRARALRTILHDADGSLLTADDCEELADDVVMEFLAHPPPTTIGLLARMATFSTLDRIKAATRKLKRLRRLVHEPELKPSGPVSEEDDEPAPDPELGETSESAPLGKGRWLTAEDAKRLWREVEEDEARLRREVEEDELNRRRRRAIKAALKELPRHVKTFGPLAARFGADGHGSMTPRNIAVMFGQRPETIDNNLRRHLPGFKRRVLARLRAGGGDPPFGAASMDS
jgi:hypothetical protein